MTIYQNESAEDWRRQWECDPVANACLIRVTNQCNQRCLHCAFRSGPECIGQMSVEMCEQINAWAPLNIVFNIMGGEFSVLDNYPDMLVSLARHKDKIHLVTNGFWAHDDPDKFLETLDRIKATACRKIQVAISTDTWHTVSSELAFSILKGNENIRLVIDAGDLGVDDISPIGRAWDNQIIPRGPVVCSCAAMCNMTITEDGMICRCPYGYFPWKHFSETTWREAQDHVLEWRSTKLAEGMTCLSCMECDHAAKIHKENNNG